MSHMGDTLNELTIPIRKLTRSRVRGAISGTTLIELMVAITIGLLVLAALATLFAYNSQARREIDNASKQIENGRYALEVLRDDIHQAGFFSSYDGTGATKQTTAGCIPGSASLSAANLGWVAPTSMPLSLYGYASGDIPVSESCITNAKSGSDVVVVRRLESIPKNVSDIVGAGSANEYYFQTSGCGDTSVDPANKPFVVASGGSGATASFVLHGNRLDHTRNCIDIAQVRKLVVRLYYVGTCSVCTGGGDGLPTLRMVELTGGAMSNVPLVEGIESLSLEYALDTDGNGTIDATRRCKVGVDACDATAWSNVMAVTLRVLARNLDKTSGYSDSKVYNMGLAGTITPSSDPTNYPVEYKRHLYSAQVTMFNQSGPRE